MSPQTYTGFEPLQRMLPEDAILVRPSFAKSIIDLVRMEEFVRGTLAFIPDCNPPLLSEPLHDDDCHQLGLCLLRHCNNDVGEAQRFWWSFVTSNVGKLFHERASGAISSRDFRVHVETMIEKARA